MKLQFLKTNQANGQIKEKIKQVEKLAKINMPLEFKSK